MTVPTTTNTLPTLATQISDHSLASSNIPDASIKNKSDYVLLLKDIVKRNSGSDTLSSQFKKGMATIGIYAVKASRFLITSAAIIVTSLVIAAVLTAALYVLGHALITGCIFLGAGCFLFLIYASFFHKVQPGPNQTINRPLTFPGVISDRVKVFLP